MKEQILFKLIEKLLESENEPIKKESELIGQKVIVRTYSAGVFYGVLKRKSGQFAAVENARRIWYWDGAASLSQLAVDGTSEPENCKFPESVELIELEQVVETLKTTEKAQKSIEAVTIWKK